MKNSAKKIIYISDPEILAIPIIECNEPLIDLKNQKQLRYGPPPETALTIKCYTKVRKTIYEKLYKAQDDLPKGWYFRLYEGFRSIEVQRMLFEQEYKKNHAINPSMDHQELFRETTRLVSPVENLDGSMNIPSHNTGGAIDIEIVMDNGQLIDMGMKIKDWSRVNTNLCLSDCRSLSPQVRKNRRILLEVMENHDFVNYPTEWWHFSYGDRYWAYHKEQHAIYGSADRIYGQ